MSVFTEAAWWVRRDIVSAAPAPRQQRLYVRKHSNMRTDYLDVEQNKMVSVHVLTMALKMLDKIRYEMLQRRRPVDRDTELTPTAIRKE